MDNFAHFHLLCHSQETNQNVTKQVTFKSTRFCTVQWISELNLSWLIVFNNSNFHCSGTAPNYFSWGKRFRFRWNPNSYHFPIQHNMCFDQIITNTWYLQNSTGICDVIIHYSINTWYRYNKIQQLSYKTQREYTIFVPKFTPLTQ